MLLSADLPKTFWGEAITIVSYLINRCPSSALGFKTPMELWGGKPSYYSNLRVFGALAFAHIKQDKLGARTDRCAFIGYPPGIKGTSYGRWNRVNQTVSSAEM